MKPIQPILSRPMSNAFIVSAFRCFATM